MVRKQQKVKRSGPRWNGDRFKHKSLLAKRELDMTILLRSDRADCRGKLKDSRSAIQNSYVYLHIDLDELTDKRLLLGKTTPLKASGGFRVRHVIVRQMTNGTGDELVGGKSDG